ncbi:MAG: helix-turn-helix domain-containing protein [Mycobacteriales bacterium]
MLSVSDVAKRVRRDPETVRHWIRGGQLPAHKIGTQHFVDEGELATFTQADTTPLPDQLQRMYDGSPMPSWETAIRSSRDSN